MDVHYSVQIDSDRKIFRWSTPVYRGSDSLPQAITGFFNTLASEQGTFSSEKNKIIFHEEIPFSWGPQPTLRQRFYRFLRRAERCRHLLQRMSQIEKIADANSLLEP